MRRKTIPIVDSDNYSDPFNTICDLKWNYPIFHMERGEFRSCCRTPSKPVSEATLEKLGTDAFLNNYDMLQSRLALVQGKRHEDCRSCWGLEDAGMSSPRHDPDKFWHQLLRSKTIPYNQNYSEELLRVEMSKIQSIHHPALKSHMPYMLEVSLGNTCDMKCMYCNHVYSTQWATERIKHGEITQEQYDREFPKANDKFEEYYWKWFDTVKLHLGRIGAIGGEPLIMPEFYRFVEKSILAIEPVKHLRKKRMTFWIVTNLNTPPNYMNKFLEYLPKLTEHFDVEILGSMEAVGNRAEYIRNGLDWERFVSNLDKILGSKFNFEFGFISSINALSIATTVDFIKFTENLYKKYNRPISLKQAVVNYPSHQSPFVLTTDFARYIDEAIEYMQQRTGIMPEVSDFWGRWDQYIIFLQNLANSLRNNNQDRLEDRKKFYTWFSKFDERRKLNFVETFPEYADFFDMTKHLQ
jgi:hypothetical protein